MTLDPAPPPVIRAGARFDGVLVLHRAARIDGHVRGDVRSPDRVWIGEEGCVEARIEAEEVVVAGEVIGEVSARRRIELLPSARVQASLASPRVSVAEGCRLEGRCLTASPKTGRSS